MAMDQQAMMDSGFGPYSVTVLPHVLVKLPDGVHLAVKFWFPNDLQRTKKLFGDATLGSFLMYSGQQDVETLEDKFPVIMEYLPYRKSDFTIPRDHRRHPWIASHGYVIARVDMRGSGDSEGLYYDEYTLQEQRDACDIIHWFSEQPWCNGKVGMFGKSWGGFNGLQVAYHQPPALAAVISLYSTDCRYLTDVHWDGGCVLGGGMLSWASRMFLWNCTPPSPVLVPNWKQEWHQRLEKASASWSKLWLTHQTRDDYWKQGSIYTDYSKVKCPVLAIGGWRDAYTDAVFRFVRKLSSVKGIIGPWSHDWPDVAKPGPNIEFLQVCLNWWDYHLKGRNNGVQDLPKFRVYIGNSIPPSPKNEIDWPGKWLVQPCWPPIDPLRFMTFIPEADTRILHNIQEAPKMAEERVSIRYTSASGQWAGEWLSFGESDAPADQQTQDGISTCWTTQILDKDLPILGFPVLKTKAVVSAVRACLAVRLCDVFPDGQSTLITYGLFNLAHHKGYDEGQQERLVPGKEYPVTIELHSAGYTVPKGHQLRVGISSSYWPGMWPTPAVSEVNLILGQAQIPKSGIRVFHTQLLLPIVEDDPTYLSTDDKSFFPKGSPKLGPELQSTRIQSVPGKYGLSTGFSFTEGLYTRTINTDSGMVDLKEADVQVSYRETNQEKYTIKEMDPLSAKVVIEQTLKMVWPPALLNKDQVEVEISTQSEMSGDDHVFMLHNKVKVKLNGQDEFDREWKDEVSKDFV